MLRGSNVKPKPQRENFSKGIRRKWLQDQNLPEQHVSREEKVWFTKIAIGFTHAGGKVPDVRKYYENTIKDLQDQKAKNLLKLKSDLGLVDYELFKKLVKKHASHKKSFFLPSQIQEVDFICLIGTFDEEDVDIKRTWILEGKKKPSHRAIGETFVYEDLFRKDYPDMGETQRGLVCEGRKQKKTFHLIRLY